MPKKKQPSPFKQILRNLFFELRYWGWQRYCPICGHHLRGFVTGGARNRPNAMCPACRSLERHRMIWVFFQRRTDLFDGKTKKMLHFAPENAFGSLRDTIGNGYMSADLHKRAMARVDITDIQFPDGTFDVIYCSHVLEHVADDAKAIREIARVLTNNGWALIVVPINAPKTMEDPSVTDPAQRLKIFGQADHVRRCGPDYVKRLQDNGLIVREFRPGDVVTPRERRLFGLMSGTVLYYCTKRDPGPSFHAQESPSSVRPPASDIIIPSKLRGDERFLRYLSFAILGTEERAKKFLGEIFQYREEAAKSFGRNLTGAPQIDLNRAAGGLLNQIVLDSVGDAVKRGLPITTGITAGYDSRAVLVVLRQNHISASATYTFGQQGFVDFDFAKVLATHLGMDNRFFDTSTMQWSLDEYQQSALKFQDFPISPRVMVDHFLERDHPVRAEIHGYLNGCLTGSMVPPLESASWEAAVTAFCGRNNPFLLHEILGEDLVRSLLPGKPLADSRNLPYDRQLDLSFRLYQRIRPVGNDRTLFILPFEDKRWIGFWLNQTFEKLRGQKTYIAFLKSLNAEEFFEIDHAAKQDRNGLNAYRRELLYGSATPPVPAESAGPSGRVIPRNPHAHFSLFACYRNNPAFKTMVDESISRLRGRRVFYSSFIDGAMQRFEAGREQDQTTVNALVSTDIMLEAGVL